MRAGTLGELRRMVHAQSMIDLGKRLRNGPLRPSLEEICMGCFVEDIEMQVRDAALELNRKGYCTISSGFLGDNFQAIHGTFNLDRQTIENLRASGVSVNILKWRGRNLTEIKFPAIEPDTEAIKAKWLEIIGLIPSRKRPAIISEGYGTYRFREFYMLPESIKRLRLERLVQSKRNPRWMKRWEKQLNKLKT